MSSNRVGVRTIELGGIHDPKQLGNAVHRPTLIPTPMPALKLVYGAELVDTLLGSQRVIPEKLQQSGFTFAHPDLDGALRAVLA